MIPLIIGSVGFLCYFTYDINSITKQNRFLQKGFLIGTFLVAAASVGMLVTGWKNINWESGLVWMCLLFGIMMFGLLIYTLFFALPFESTYVEENKQRLAYTEGVYALCRHPGVLWYGGMYLCMAGMIRTQQSVMQAVVFILWNIAYVILQDRIIFPRTFTNYGDYKRTAPFLFPNKRSMKRCLETGKFRKKGGRA